MSLRYVSPWPNQTSPGAGSTGCEPEDVRDEKSELSPQTSLKEEKGGEVGKGEIEEEGEGSGETRKVVVLEEEGIEGEGKPQVFQIPQKGTGVESQDLKERERR